ncbi:MAG: hypothetical protein ABJE95_00105 [Byssovorax sp.]
MILPFRRDALAARELLDEQDEMRAHAEGTPSERLAMALGLSELVRKLARSAGSRWVDEGSADLETKAALYVAPLRALMRS